MKWGGTHRFHDAAAVEAKHRVSLKSNGKKVRVRTNTQTEKDLLQVTQEELVFESVQELLNAMSESDPSPLTVTEEISAYDADPKCKETVLLTMLLVTKERVHGARRDNLVHQEVLLSWGELVDMFVHCFPSVGAHVLHEETTWEVYQHALHEFDGTRYHYWGTDSGYPNISRSGTRRRRDMVRVSIGGKHLAQIVCFVKARLPTPSNGTPVRPEVVGALVRWLTPHADSIIHDGAPTCPGPLFRTHNLWSWHRTKVKRTSISGYFFGRLPDAQKAWLQPATKREGLLFASYDVIELQSIGKYANVTPDFCTNGFLESVSWA